MAVASIDVATGECSPGELLWRIHTLLKYELLADFKSGEVHGMSRLPIKLLRTMELSPARYGIVVPRKA